MSKDLTEELGKLKFDLLHKLIEHTMKSENAFKGEEFQASLVMTTVAEFKDPMDAPAFLMQLATFATVMNQKFVELAKTGAIPQELADKILNHEGAKPINKEGMN